MAEVPRKEELKWNDILLSWPAIAALVASICLSVPIVYVWVRIDHQEGDVSAALGAFGAVLTGLATTITFVWIGATFILQLKELSAQRAELTSQREAQQATSYSLRIDAVIRL